MTILYNTIGYHINADKFAYWAGENSIPKQFVVRQADTNTEVLRKELPPSQFEALFELNLQLCDFSEIREKGEYILEVGDFQQKIVVGEKPWEVLAQGVLKSFYFQRASMELEPQFAGKWARPAGHPDTEVLIHASAAEAILPEGAVISAPKGWYDAGDYNKYIVNSGISVWKILAVVEHLPQLASKISFNIPPDELQLPDLLVEVKWNLDWMSNMQAPDGGVYHKLTNLSFDSMQMPHTCLNPRYVVMKSTAASLYFAASMAQAARVYKEYIPKVAKFWLNQAERAFAWALDNPEQHYVQPDDINTGPYANSHTDDELYWAAWELWISTGKDIYQKHIDAQALSDELPQWWSVSTLGAISAAMVKKDEGAKEHILRMAQQLRAQQKQSPVHLAMQKDDFIWGSNGIVATQGMILLIAAQLSSEKHYIQDAVRQLDYLLGINPLGRSFVSGFGKNPPRFLHHRVSAGDDIDEPIPGFLVGGPNIEQQDAHRLDPYPKDPPTLSYVDKRASFATNEIAINWNAPMVYLLWAVEELLTY